jgi:uncharacterized membrane protein
MDKGIIAVVIYSVINAWAGLLLIGVGIPFYLRRIRPNTWTGLRTERTLGDSETWYAANRTMGLDLMLVGGALLVSTTVCFLFRERVTFLTLVIANLGIVMAGVTWIVFHSLWVFRRRDGKQI